MLASRRKAESWAPICVTLLYFREHRSTELLQATVEFDELEDVDEAEDPVVTAEEDAPQ